MKKVLVVDDEPDILRVVSFRLKKSGYDVFIANNGKAALDLISGNKPDLILLDLRMPVMGGEEVCMIIKNDETLKNIPIILLTASTGEKVSEKAKELGMNDYLVKPFDSDILLRKVQKLIG